MTSQQKFSKVYSQLNPAQKKAADTIDGPVMVIAGPGTGKTQILAARIANILQKTDTKPQNILALTFTESGAKNMRERIVGMIGREGYYVQISTFHSFCVDVITNHSEFFPIDRSSEALTDLERYNMFEELITKNKELDVIKPINRPLYFLKDVMSAIADLKREGISPEEFDQLINEAEKDLDSEREDLTKAKLAIAQKNIIKQKELSLIYYRYQQNLRETLRYDFEDMISLVAGAFETQELLLAEYQENLHYFLVDEYQDTNSAQNQVVTLLAKYWQERANIFVVGDPHQSIYRFQGAAAENVIDFARQYPEAEVVTMTQGYRCPQIIYDAAHELIGHNSTLEYSQESAALKSLKKSLAQKLQSEEKPTGAKITITAAPTQTLELIDVVDQIEALLAQGVASEKIAVLYRRNSDSQELAEILQAKGIDFEIDGGSDVLRSEVIRQLLQFLQVIRDQQADVDNELYFEVLNYDWLKMNRLVVMKLARISNQSNQSIHQLITAGETDTVKSSDLKPFVDFQARLSNWLSDDANLVFPEWFEKVIRESGFLDWVIKDLDSAQNVLQINALFREIKALAGSRRGLKLAEFLGAMQTMIDHKISIEIDTLNTSKGAVRLSTVHKAKGQEWDHVFVIHCLDGIWGNNRVRDLLPLPSGVLKNTDLSKQERNEDERRLFYVAITRASEAVHLSYPQQVVQESRQKAVIRSMFIEELPESLRESRQVFESEQQAVDAIEELLTSEKKLTGHKKITSEEKAFFEHLVKNFKLSVTALNTYLRDPREFVLKNLLRVPRSKPEHMAFGTAIHVSLEKLYGHLMMTGEKLALKDLNKKYQDILERELLTTKDFQRRLKYGLDLLSKYHADFNLKTPVVYVERFFGKGRNQAILNDSDPIHLTGRIDRVDWIDQAKKLVKVVDYKTGKARSINNILGQTASVELSEREQTLPENIRGPYIRQLLFYKLLADLDPTFIPSTSSGEFEFVEPDKKTKKTVTRSFDLTDEDVNELKKLIKEVMLEIRGLAFIANYLNQNTPSA